MASDVDERARVLCLGLSLQSGTDDSDAGFAHVVMVIAAALRAAREAGRLERDREWEAEAQKRVARLLAGDTAPFNIDPGTPTHWELVGHWEIMAEGVEDFCEAMGVTLDRQKVG